MHDIYDSLLLSEITLPLKLHRQHHGWLELNDTVNYTQAGTILARFD